ncbi:MAG: 1-deoxy-D-xylulose-5-phosphate synthase [Elusimicrobia bacterium CG03_land_8_20_14_0_80_50_18]|nr:MAG: 1-deoxy-D-xylulose-5-phosphate synthase [Elusimicrobia bacterium CG03_land_8_20_14_0_80_50_18]PIX14184.1 MAG: 1-deoxy-D-xylulose-5-phosphate synthase [Elusimicrobia bacterium CG_4_8_14_3_um_filter_50_9]
MAILDMIDSPAELRLIRRDLLPGLVAEIREKIIDTCSKTGGHLGGSLGAVELITALHYVFDCPEDKIVFDVGHQAYAHKILTGRASRFETNRQFGGISGFPKMAESEYDAFGVGHASTSISAAYGMACARDIKGGKNKVIAVIGDGALTGGLAYEGLNNAGCSGTDILVILNDNNMFISPRVGAMGSMLTRIFSLGIVKKTEESVVNLLKRLKVVGLETLRIARRVKTILFPGMFFEEMGFSCFGPVDGHDLDRLIFLLGKLKKFKGPVFLHVITKKGKGYKPAEENPASFHGLGAFDKVTGEISPPSKSYSDVFGDVLCELAAKDGKIAAVTAAMPAGTGLLRFAEEFPARFFDCGIAEEHAVTFAAGLASQGIKPVVALYSTFLQRAFDQVIHDVCLQNLNVVFAVDRAGLVGGDGPTHHGNFDISYLRIIPGMTVCAPKDVRELADMLYSALKYGGPVALRYPRAKAEEMSAGCDFTFIEQGKAETLIQGGDVRIAALGSMVYPALLISQELAGAGIKCGVINARFAKPLDVETLTDAAENAKLLVTLEENTSAGGFGSAVMEELPAALLSRVRRIALPDRFITHGSIDELKEASGIDVSSVVKKIKGFMKK